MNLTKHAPINDWRSDRKPGPWRAPSREALAYAPASIAEAIAQYERIEGVRAEAAAALYAAQDALAHARDRLVEESVNAILENIAAPDGTSRDLEDAHEAARIRNGAANIASHDARQRVQDAIRRDGDEWIANVSAASGEACMELLATAERVEELLSPVVLTTSVGRFVAGARRSGIGKMMFAEARLSVPLIDSRGVVTGEISADALLRDLRRLVAEVEAVLHPSDDDAADLPEVDALDDDGQPVDLSEVEVLSPGIEPANEMPEPAPRRSRAVAQPDDGIEIV